MPETKRYQRKDDTEVTAIQMRLNFDGFSYTKWGGVQRCKPNDWLVCKNPEDVYTVDDEVFRSTYQPVYDMPGRYRKTGTVWALRANKSGTIKTKEGSTDYNAGDFLVANDREFDDAWAMSEQEFHDRYKEDQ